jgi:Vanillate O-demethylase oxygenase C-terminal domain
MFCFARDFSLDDAEMSKLLFEGSKATFLEDVDFLEAVQTNRVDGSLDGLIHVTGDAAQLQARRMLTTMISAEQS